MKLYLKIILVVVVIGLWIAIGHLSKINGTATTGGCGCGEGTPHHTAH